MVTRRVNPRIFRFALDAVVTNNAQSNAGLAANQVKIAAADGAVDNAYNWRAILMTGGVAAGQVRRILKNVSATKILTVGRLRPNDNDAWDGGIPDNTDPYVIFTVLTSHPMQLLSMAAGSSPVLIQFAADQGCPIQDDVFNNLDVALIAGTSSNYTQAIQRRRIIDYTGATRTARVSAPFDNAFTPGNDNIWSVQQHLYFPCTALEIYLEDVTNLNVATNLGGLGFGDYKKTTQWPPSELTMLPEYVEVAAVAAGKTAIIERWE